MTRDHIKKMQEIPNIGPAMTRDFNKMGITQPKQLIGKDPYKLYKKLEQITGHRQDPCVLDTFISAVRYMEGAPPKPWFAYTAERKKKYKDI